jgi:spore coat protein U-like protein
MIKKFLENFFMFTLLLLSSVLPLARALADIARVEIIRDYDDFFRIKDKNNVEIGRFRVEVLRNAVKNPDGSISLCLKLRDIRFLNEIFYNNQKIESVNEEKIVALSIPYEELQNEAFTHTVRFSSDNLATVFEDVKLRITPEVSISSEVTDVNFGVVIYENGRIYGNQQHVQFSYSILKDAHCEIDSENGFRLKRTGGENYIPYTVTVYSGELTDLQPNVKIMAMDSKSSSFSLMFDPSSACVKMPLAGNYADSVTVTLMSD